MTPPPEQDHYRIWPPLRDWPSGQRPWFALESPDYRLRIQQVRRRAEEVLLWFEQQPLGEDLALSTRPPSLEPEWPARTPSVAELARGPEPLYQEVIESVIRKREAALAGRRTMSLNQARFLAYEAFEQVSDGGSQFSSRGFFDHLDEPGWATWIDGYVDRKIGSRLLCCIPAELVPAVQAGIDGNVVDCIHWVDCPELTTPA